MFFLRKAFFVWAFSDFGWFPSLVLEPCFESVPSDLFFLIETFEPVRGKLTVELLRFVFEAVGLPVGVCDADRVW